jgi:predicted ATPase
VQYLLSAYRAVTLTGPVGIGKTALALKTARSLFPTFEGDGFIVELASLSEASRVPSAVAGVLALNLGGRHLATT